MLTFITRLFATPARPSLAVRLGVDVFEDRLAPSDVLVHEQVHQSTPRGSDVKPKDTRPTFDNDPITLKPFPK
jgi:hypothetical protein